MAPDIDAHKSNPESQNPIMIVSTYPDKTAASKAATHLVKAGLAACVNVSEISSFYSWKGEIISDQKEQIAIFKTTTARKKDLKEEINRTHPYDVPEIAEISISDINGPYMRWLESSTATTTAAAAAAATTTP